MLSFVILTPELRLTKPAVRFDEILLLGLTIIFGIYLVRKKRFKLSVIDYIFGALFVSVLASIFISYIKQDFFYFNDIFEVVKLVKYYLIYTIIFNLSWLKRDRDLVIRTAIISFTVAILFSFAQYFNLFSINNSIMPFFTRENHIRAIMVAGRVVGTFKNANSWALVLGIPIFFGFATLIKKFEFKSRAHLVPLVILLFGALTSMIMTMGRTSSVANFVALFVISAALLLFPYREIGRPKIAKNIFIAFSIFIIITALSLLFVNNVSNGKGTLNYVERFEAGIQEMGYIEEGTVEGEFQSWSSRKEKWTDVVSRVAENPVFGVGPSKSSKSSDHLPYIVDNEYLLYLYRYGLLGLCLYVGLFFTFFFYGILNLKNTSQKIDGEFIINIIALGVSVSYPLYNILAGSFYDFQLFPLFVFWGALNLNILERNER